MFNLESLTQACSLICNGEHRIPPTVNALLRETNLINIVVSKVYNFLDNVPQFMTQITSQGLNHNANKDDNDFRSGMLHGDINNKYRN